MCYLKKMYQTKNKIHHTPDETRYVDKSAKSPRFRNMATITPNMAMVTV